jgi:hypothetical protein
MQSVFSTSTMYFLKWVLAASAEVVIFHTECVCMSSCENLFCNGKGEYFTRFRAEMCDRILCEARSNELSSCFNGGSILKKFRTAISSGKVMLILFFDSKGTILQHWLRWKQAMYGLY